MLSVNQELVIDFIDAVRLFTIQVGIVFSTMGLRLDFDAFIDALIPNSLPWWLLSL